MDVTLICMKMKLHAELSFALRLVLKQRQKRTQEWPIYFLVPNRIRSIPTYISQYNTAYYSIFATNNQDNKSVRHLASQLFPCFAFFSSHFFLLWVTTGQVASFFGFAAYHCELDPMFVESINQRRASEGCGWSQNATAAKKRKCYELITNNNIRSVLHWFSEINNNNNNIYLTHT